MTEEKETVRYDRRTIEVKGLVQYKELPPDAIQKMSEYGVHWSLTGGVRLEPQVLKTTKLHIGEGMEVPSSLTSVEKDWVKEMAEQYDIGWVESTEEELVHPAAPFIESHILLHDPADDTWVKEWIVGHDIPCTAKITLSRSSSKLLILLEGTDKNSISNTEVDLWVQKKIKLIRDSLAHAGFTEKDLEIDCEVIMGAEREAKCDPDFMRSLIADSQEEE